MSPKASRQLTPMAAAIAYGGLGAVLLATRFIALEQSYWHDEIWTIQRFVDEGPREILLGHYLPNNHELFSLLAWATASLVGDSEIALRLLSVIPFVVGAVGVAAWLHVRHGPLSGLIWLFLVACAPMLTDITRQARGYGLAFLAMSVLVVAALEATRNITPAIAAFCAAGLIGTMTLPTFGIAFLSTGAVLLSDPRLRRAAGVGLAISVGALAAWYAPHAGDLAVSSRQDFGTQIHLLGLPAAPVDRILLPGLLAPEGMAPVGSAWWVPVIAAVATVLATSPLLHARQPAAILTVGIAATTMAFWLTRATSVPRFFSFLLVPMFIALATGTADVLGRLQSRPPLVRTLSALTLLVVIAGASGLQVTALLRLPREAHKDVAAIVRDRAPHSTPVFVYMRDPEDLRFYLDRPLRTRRTPATAAELCNSGRPAVLVVAQYRMPPMRVPCARSPGTRHYVLGQRVRGDEMHVWFINVRSKRQR